VSCCAPPFVSLCIVERRGRESTLVEDFSFPRREVVSAGDQQPFLDIQIHNRLGMQRISYEDRQLLPQSGILQRFVAGKNENHESQYV